MNSLKHAGAPWELGLAETQQTLLLNGLRDRIVVQVDGQLKTGRDVVVAALLGAEEYGFASAPLVVSGCIMMRVCHLDTCPVGIATQNPELRKRFAGSPDFVVTFFQYIADEVRELLAEMGFRTLEEAIGHPEAIDHTRAIDHWKAAGLDLGPILEAPVVAPDAARRCIKEQDHGLHRALDQELIREAEPALADALPVRLAKRVRNVNRTVGTLLGAEVTRRYGGSGLPDGTIDISLVGSAGQSLGAFLPRGITIRLEGDANDYVGKGLSGGRVILRPSGATPAGVVAAEQIIAGNVLLYGATSGEAFIRGVVGERFCVRNSGALAVVEGVGDHGCEYMTGGRVVVLGGTGRNFGAGMSGGIAYVWDPEGRFEALVNKEMVNLEPLTDDDAAWLAGVIGRHRELTGSTTAAAVLDGWAEAKETFVKVMPKDYQRVLDAAAKAEAEGIDVDEAIMAAAHG
jgi:glutamate synthase (NADPH/NADH) large chain